MTDLQQVHARVANTLAELSELFKPGMKLTFIARHPDHGERHIIVTDDDLSGLIALLTSESVAKSDAQKLTVAQLLGISGKPS